MLPYKPEDEIEYMRTHPPVCIGQLSQPAPPDIIKLIQEEYGEHTVVFGTKCGCGGYEFTVEYLDDAGKVTLICSQCEKRVEIFNPYKHGYNGALDLYEPEEINEEPVINECTECGNAVARVYTGYQYAGDTAVLNEEGAPEVNPEDLFGWYILAAECPECGNLEIAFEEECI